MDEAYFIYLSGARGTGGGYVWSANNPFFNVNPLTAPDAMHQMYGGVATSKASLATTDTFKLRLIDKAIAKAETMGDDGSDELSMIPVNIEGGDLHRVDAHVPGRLAVPGSRRCRMDGL